MQMRAQGSGSWPSRRCEAPIRIARLPTLPYMGRRRRGELPMLLAFFNVLDLLLRVVSYIIIAQAILSWLVAFNVINTHSDFMRSFLTALDRITEPLYRPIRRVLPDFGGIDFSPLVALLIIIAVQMLLGGLARDLMMSGAA
jgi:YggT family protein